MCGTCRKAPTVPELGGQCAPCWRATMDPSAALADLTTAADAYRLAPEPERPAARGAAPTAAIRFLAAAPDDGQYADAREVLRARPQIVTLGELGKLARTWRPRPASAADDEDTAAPLASRFGVHEQDRSVFRWRRRPGGESYRERLMDAAVWITCAWFTDHLEPYPADGQPPEPPAEDAHHLDAYDLRVLPHSGDRREVILPGVSSDELDALKFLHRAGAGLGHVMHAPGRESAKLIAQVIRSQSLNREGVPERARFDRIGWHVRADPWGHVDCFYVHAGGGIGPDGPREDIQARPDEMTQWYRLPAAPADLDDGRAAVRAVLGLFDMTPDHVAAPAIGAAFRAAMGRPSGSVAFTGLNTSGKSAVMANIVQMFAPAARYNRFPTPGAEKENLSAAQFERLANAIGDALLPLDDISSDDSPEIQRRTLSKLVRPLYNGGFRGRMNRDRTQGDTRPPRTLGVITLEGLSAAESIENRTHIITVRRGDVDREAMKAADGAGGPERRAAAMAGFLQWWAARMPAVRETADRRDLAGKFLAGKLPTVDMRHIENVADGLLAGALAFMDYAEDAGYLTTAESATWRARFEAGMVESTRAQADRGEGRSLGHRMTELLWAGLSSGACHVELRDPEAFGADYWRDGSGWGWITSDAEGTLRPGGPMVGWTDGRTLLLSPSQAHRYLVRVTSDLQEPLTATSRGLAEALHTEGLISATRSKDRTREVLRYGTSVKINGRAERVWDLKVPADDPEPGGPSPAAPGPELDPGPGVQAAADPPELGADDWTGASLTPEPEPAAPRPETAAEVPADDPEPPRRGRGGVARYNRKAPAAAAGRAAQEPDTGTTRRTPRDPARVRVFAVTLAGVQAGSELYPLPEPLSLPGVLEAPPRNGRRAAVEQFLIGPDIMAALDLPELPPAGWGDRDARDPELPYAVALLAAAGWRGIAKSGDLPAFPWMQLSKAGTTRRADVILTGWRADTEFPAAPGASITEQAKRLSAAAVLLGRPCKGGEGSTATRMLRDLTEESARAGNWPRWVAAEDTWPAGLREATERGLTDWDRRPRKGEGAHLATYDANKAHLAAYREPLASDDLTATGPIEFDPRRAGLWQVRAPKWTHPELPPPWACYGSAAPGSLLWLPTPIVALFDRAGLPVDVADSWTARGVELKGFREFADRVRKGLESLEAPGSDPALRSYLKTLYRAGYGAMKSGQRTIRRPDWYVTIAAASWAARWRDIWATWQETGRAPVAVHVDAITYASDEADPAAACPLLGSGGRSALGTRQGQYKITSQEAGQ